MSTLGRAVAVRQQVLVGNTKDGGIMQDSDNFSDHDSQIGYVSSSYVERSRIILYFINLTVLVLVALAGALMFAQAPTRRLSPLMDRDKEFLTAINSAPPEIRDSTGVFVLEDHGFTRYETAETASTVLWNGAPAIFPQCAMTQRAPLVRCRRH